MLLVCHSFYIIIFFSISKLITHNSQHSQSFCILLIFDGFRSVAKYKLKIQNSIQKLDGKPNEAKKWDHNIELSAHDDDYVDYLHATEKIFNFLHECCVCFVCANVVN